MVIVFLIIMNGKEKTFLYQPLLSKSFSFPPSININTFFYIIASVNGYVNKHNLNNQKGLSKNLGLLRTVYAAIINNSFITQNNLLNSNDTDSIK